MPVALSVIPRDATRDLAERVKDLSSVMVLQHGWSHLTHETGTLNEYPASRPESEVSREIAMGRDLLRELFGRQALPVFVPPFHGFDARHLPLLTRNGIAALSRKGPRRKPAPGDELLQVNAHVSTMKWGDPLSFGEDEDYLTIVIRYLRARRTGRFDRDEPTGLLTHHLFQNERSFDFVARFIDALSAHRIAKWLHPREVFPIDCG